MAVGIAALVALWLRAGSDEAPTRATSDVAHSRGSSVPRVEVTRIGGRVTRASDGTGLPGAVIALTAKTTPPSAPVVALADADGSWGAPLTAGSYRVVATADGFVPRAEDWVVSPGAQLDLALVAGGARVHGTITDLGGGPVPDAMVTFTAGDDTVAAVTDSRGRYRVTVSEGTYEVVASHDAYAAAGGSFDAREGLDFDLVLVPAGTIRGVVVARATGRPVPDALVEADGGIQDRKTHVHARSESDGTFVLRHVGPGALGVNATARGFVTYAATTVEIAVGEQIEGVRVLADRGYAISGRLVREGQPAQGLQVVAWEEHSHDDFAAVAASDARGGFEVVGLRPGQYGLNVTAPDLTVQYTGPIAVVDRDISDVVREVVPLTQPLSKTVSGRVDPPGPASIELLGSGDLATADASGVFSIKRGSTDSNVLRATTSDGAVGVVQIKAGEASISGVVIHTSPGVTLSGRVIDERGSPIAGAWVSASPVDRAHRGEGRSATADAAGRFLIKALPAGKVRLIASDRGHDEDRASTVDPPTLELAAGEQRSNLTVVVEARITEVTGTVVDRGGAPVADAWVTARRIEPDRGWATTSPVATRADGSFTIDALRAGLYEVVAIGSRGESRGTAEIRGGSSASIKLAPLGSIIGRVVRGGAPVTSYQLRCGGSPSGDRHVDASDGTFVLDHLEPRNYACVATTAEGRAQAEVQVTTGPTTVELRIPVGASVTGVAINVVTGQPISGLTVSITDDGRGAPDPAGTGLTDASGRFVVEHVPASGGLRFAIPGHFSHSNAARFTVQDGQRVDVGVVKLEPPGAGEPGELGLVTSSRDPSLVTQIEPGGPADQAGVRVDDRLTTFDGLALADLERQMIFRLVAFSPRAGQTIHLGLARGVTVSVTAVAH